MPWWGWLLTGIFGTAAVAALVAWFVVLWFGYRAWRDS